MAAEEPSKYQRRPALSLKEVTRRITGLGNYIITGVSSWDLVISTILGFHEGAHLSEGGYLTDLGLADLANG